MGGIVNSITAPAGLKLFKGGPYKDSGLGDVEQQKQKSAEGVYNNLGDYGSRLLTATAGTARTPGTGLDPFSGLDKATNAYASTANGGLTAPQGYAGKLPGLLHDYGVTGGYDDTSSNNDPYGLLPHEQEALNQGLNDINTQRDTALSHARQQYAAKGLTDGSSLDSVLQSIHDHYDNQALQHQTQFHETARQNRQSTIQNLLQGYNSLTGVQESQHARQMGDQGQLINAYGNRIAQGTGLMGQQAGGLMGSAQMTGQQAQLASNNNGQAWGNIMSLAGFAGGGGFGGLGGGGGGGATGANQLKMFGL